jgi:hypothetical protein
MPNIEILRQFDESVVLEAIRASNRMKVEREARGKLVATSTEEVAV